MPTRSLRIFVIFLIVPLILSCTRATSAFSPAPTQAEIEKEERAIYSFFVGDGSRPVLILENTSTDISSGDPEEMLDYIKSGLEGVSNETLDNFIERNQEPGVLPNDMDLGAEYILLTSEELYDITSQPSWNEVMEQKYGAVGYTSFSRVGFNRSLDQAVVYVGQMAGPLMGAGYYYLFEKEMGQWKIKKEVMAWIS